MFFTHYILNTAPLSQFLPHPHTPMLSLSLEKGSRRSMSCMEGGWSLTKGIADLVKTKNRFSTSAQPGLEPGQEERGVAESKGGMLKKTAIEWLLTRQNWMDVWHPRGTSATTATGRD